MLAAPEPFNRRVHMLVRRYLHEEDDACRKIVADRAVKATNRALWRTLHRRWSTEACAHIDRLASRLEAGSVPEPIGLHVEAVAEEIGVPRWGTLHAGWLVAAASAHPVVGPTRAAAGVLRAFGVAACAEHGMAARCPCLLRGLDPAPGPGREHGPEHEPVGSPRTTAPARHRTTPER
jgi:hypothetical protein